METGKLIKKLLSVVLSVLLTVTTLPTFAFRLYAEGEAVAQIGDTKYTNFDTALSEWDAGETLTLLADVSSTSTKVIDGAGNYTLNLGDYTWTADGCDAISLEESGALSANLIINSSENGGIRVIGSDKACVRFERPSNDSESTVTFYGGTYTADYVYSYGISNDNGSGYDKGASVAFNKNTYGCSPLINGKIVITNSKFDMNAGTYNDDIYVCPVKSSGVYTTIKAGVKTKELVRIVHNKALIFDNVSIVRNGDYYEYLDTIPETWEVKVEASSVFTRTNDYQGGGPTYQSLKDNYYENDLYFVSANEALSLYTDLVGDASTEGTKKYYADNNITFLADNCTFTFNNGVTSNVDLTINGGHTVTIDASASDASYTGKVVLKDVSAKFVEKYGSNDEYDDSNVAKGGSIGSDKVIAIDKETINQKTYTIGDYYACQVMQEGQPGYVAITKEEAPSYYEKDELWIYTKNMGRFEGWSISNYNMPDYVSAKDKTKYTKGATDASGEVLYYAILGKQNPNGQIYYASPTGDVFFVQGESESKPVNYKTFADAYAVAKNTDKPIILLDNLAPTVELGIGDSFIVELNGFTFTDTNVTAIEGYKVVKTVNEDGAITYSTKEVEYVAQIVGVDGTMIVKKYADLQTAVNEATDGQTVQMLANINLDAKSTQEKYGVLFPAGKKISFDLNGYKLEGGSGFSNSYFLIKTLADELTLKDSSENKTGTVSFNASATSIWYGSSAISVYGGKTIVESGNYINSPTSGGAAYVFDVSNNEHAVELVINGGKFDCPYGDAVIRMTLQGWISSNPEENASKLTINDGIFTGGAGESVIWIDVETNKAFGGKCNPKCDIVINNGSFIASSDKAIFDIGSGSNRTTDNLTIIVNNGQFKSGADYIFGYRGEFNDELISGVDIKGGIFSTDKCNNIPNKNGLVSKLNLADLVRTENKTVVSNIDPDTKDEYPWTIGEISYVAQINDKKYETLQEAFNEATNGQTIQLIADSEHAATEFNKSGNTITLDLNGFTINAVAYNAGDGSYTVGIPIRVKAGNLVIDDSKGNGKIVSKEDTTYNGNYCLYLYPNSGNTCSVVLKNGTLESNKCAVLELGKSSMTIDGGKIVSNGTDVAYIQAINNMNASLMINGGEFESNGKVLFAQTDNTEVNGGFFNGIVDTKTYKPLKGGYYTMDVSNSVADGYKVVENDDVATKETYHYKVVPCDYVAQIGLNKYETLQSAILEVNDYETIKLLCDIDNAVGISVNTGKTFTIDFDKHTYTVNNPGAGSSGTETIAFQLIKGQDITFKNGTINVSENNTTEATVGKNIKRIFQSYCDVTFIDMTIDGRNVFGNNATNEFECGNVIVSGNTSFLKQAGASYAMNVASAHTNEYKFGTSVKIDTTGTVDGIYCYKDYSAINTMSKKSSLTINNGKITKVDSDNYNDVDITLIGGVYTNEPLNAYVYEGLTVVANTDETTKAQYPFTIGKKQMDIPSNPTTPDDKDVKVDVDAKQTTGEATTKKQPTNPEKDVTDKINEVLSTSSSSMADLIADTKKVEATIDETYINNARSELPIKNELNNLISIAKEQTKPVEFKVDSYLKVEVKSVEVKKDTTDDIKKIHIDITPYYRVTATSDVTGEVSNTVVIEENKPLEVTEPVMVTIPVPNGYVVTGDICVEHIHNDMVYSYEATYDKTSNTISFLNVNGFSDFIFTTGLEESVARNINTATDYSSLNEALVFATSGQTVILLKDDLDADENANLFVNAGVTLNINGYNVKAMNMVVFGTLIDNNAIRYGSITTTNRLVYLANLSTPQTGFAKIPVNQGGNTYKLEDVRLGSTWTNLSTDDKFSFKVGALFAKPDEAGTLRRAPEMTEKVLKENGDIQLGLDLRISNTKIERDDVQDQQTVGYLDLNCIFSDNIVETYRENASHVTPIATWAGVSNFEQITATPFVQSTSTYTKYNGSTTTYTKTDY